VTGYTRGINGVMLDVANLRAGAGVGDFSFAAGGPAAWAAAPTPAMSVRRGAGVNNADRVTFTWPDGAVANTWLRVTAAGSADTGLAAADVFYFGNLVGETGNTATSLAVTSLDVLKTRNALGVTAATVASPYDFNRDGRVNSLDLLTARRNQGHALALLTAPAAAGPTPSAAPSSSPATLADPYGPTPVSLTKQKRTVGTTLGDLLS
jgi:hypothetical protein